MNSPHPHRRRSAADLPWSEDRERRVLGGALRSWRRRARRRRALEISAVIAAMLLAGRMWIRFPSLPEAIDAMRAKNGASHGFAGSGGHGGAGTTGFGGSAGTG
jgi:predicted exporter